jgi:putative ABC transport system permease protein
LSLVLLGFRNSFRRPVRTGLSVLGIALCITLMLTVASVSQRYASVVTQSYSIYNSDVVVVSKASLLIQGLPLGGDIPETAVSLVKDVNGVSSATPILLVVDVHQLIPSNITIGVPLSNFSMFSEVTSVQLRGSYPATMDEAVVGSYLASVSNLSLGSTLKEGGTTLRVSGIISTSNLILGNAIIMPLATAQAVEGYGGLVSAILVDSSGTSPSALIRSIDAAIPGVVAIEPSRSESLTDPLVSSIGLINDSVDLFAVVVAFLFVAIITSVSVIEQKDEFITMRAIGSSTSSVLRVTLSQSLMMTAAGVAVGLGLSALATAAVFQVYASIPVSASLSGILDLLPAGPVVFAGSAVVGLGLLVSAVTTSSVLRGSD